MVSIELRSDLDRPVLDEILDLIAATAEIEGHRPVGEHKYAHLAVGATGWVGVLARDGAQLIGYAHTRWNPETSPPSVGTPVGDRPRMAVEVVVHPDWHTASVAHDLLEATRGVLAHAGGGLLYLWVHRVEDASQTLAARMGFRVQRELAFMQRHLDESPPAVDLPEGVELRPYRPDVDDEALLRVNNAAFKGHPENGDWDRAELADRRSRDWFDADGLLMAWRRPTAALPDDGKGEELLGFHWTKWHGHSSDEIPAHEPVGEVYVLAVAPWAQGLGLGRVLLRAGLAHLADRGCRQAILYVDCASTGAVALYASEGFTVVSKEVCYEELVAPAGDTGPAELLRPA